MNYPNIDTISVPLRTLQKLPEGRILRCVNAPNMFNDDLSEPALVVLFTCHGSVRKGLFSVKEATYMGEIISSLLEIMNGEIKEKLNETKEN